MPAKPNAAYVAQIIAESRYLGVTGVAAKYKIAPDTVRVYKREYAETPEVKALMIEAEEAAKLEWLSVADEARRVLLQRVLTLAGKSENLREVTGALKIVSDAVLAEQVVKPNNQTNVNIALVNQGRREALESIGGQKQLDAIVDATLLEADEQLASKRNALDSSSGQSRSCSKTIDTILKLDGSD